MKLIGSRKSQTPLIMQIILAIVAAALLLAIIPLMAAFTRDVSIEEALLTLSEQGYTAYADPSGDIHVSNILPNADDTYNVGAVGNEFADGYFGELILSNTSPLTLSGDARSWIEFRPDLDPTRLAVNAKPTAVEWGICLGYSLPVGGNDEELFYSICVPNRWDKESDIHMHIYAWLDTAQDEANDAVKLELNWKHVSIGDIVPDTNNSITDEVVVGAATQYTALQFDFVIDYDLNISNPVEDDSVLFFHLTRVASSHEITGEPVVYHASATFRCDKFGNPTY